MTQYSETLDGVFSPADPTRRAVLTYPFFGEANLTKKVDILHKPKLD